jgi:hypothetical protein
MPIDRHPVNQARAQLQAARVRLIRAFSDEDAKQKLLEEAQRSLEGDALQHFVDDLQDAKIESGAARAAVTQGNSAVLAAIAALVGPGSDRPSVEAEVLRIEATSPVVLLPVRIETRFGTQGPAKVLRVRIYPDEIFLNTHEYAVTAEEKQAGIDYWVPPKGETLPPESIRWRRLVDRFGAPRAAYLARAFRNINEPPYSGCAPQPYYIPGGGEITLPEIPDRPDAWSRAGDAVLPDRWVVAAYATAGSEPRIVAGLPIPEPLPLTPNPMLGENDFVMVNGELSIDKDIAWTVDYESAVATGMAITLPLTDAEAVSGFERLVVVGVKSSLGPLETSGVMEQLLDAHHYTRGLDLVPQGTPTNNTTGKPTPFPPEDPHGDLSFQVERVPPPPDLGNAHQLPAQIDGSDTPAFDFDHVATALGVANSVFRNVKGAQGREQWAAHAMTQALWPATLGYFLEQLMQPLFPLAPPLFSQADIDATRAYVARWVRGRGPVPAFRVGAVPYGVLPVVSLNHWAKRAGTDADQDLEDRMRKVLLRLREIWKQGQRPKTMKPDPNNPFDALMSILSEDASSQSVRLRDAMGAATAANLGGLGAAVLSLILGPLLQNSTSIMDELGLPAFKRPRVLGMNFATASANFHGAFAQGGPATTTVAEYIDRIEGATLLDIWEDQNLLTAGRKPLLYVLLRHAALLEWVHQARANFPTLFNNVPGREPEQWPPFNATGPVGNILDILAHAPNGQAATPANKSVFDLTRDASMRLTYFRVLDRLKAFALLPAVSDLERLVSETLDVSSHRLDAWMTAFASHRLAAMRAAQTQSCQKPIGNCLGGYGWLENVTPGGSGPPAGNAGYVHAPTKAHANAAALLRCGFVAHQSLATDKYAVDLSSERARRAQRLIEEVRAGQPVGAALGYRFERALHESYPALSLDVYIYRLRELFPQVANKSNLDPYEQHDTVAARNVVDGLALVRGPVVFTPENGLPTLITDPNAYNAIQNELRALGDLFDAAGDLLTAEAIYQMGTGDVAAAQAVLDFLPLGGNAPEGDLVRTETASVGVTHRVLLLLPPAFDNLNREVPPPLPAGWPALPDPNVRGAERARAEPFLDAWVGNRLGAATAVVATVRYKNDQGLDRTYPVSLADLKIRPLDVLAIAQDETLPNVGTELERRILGVPHAAGTGFHIDFKNTGIDPAPKLTFPQIMEVARSMAVVLGAARPATAGDLMTPLEQAETDDANAFVAAQELKARADAALGALQAADEALLGAADADPTTPDFTTNLRDALIFAARFIAGAYPPPPLSEQASDAAQLAAAALLVKGELRRRVDQTEHLQDPEDGTAPPDTAAALNGQATAMLKMTFGPSFFALPAMGALIDSAAQELDLSIKARPLLLGQDEDTLQDSAPRRFLQQVAMVRDGMRNWRYLTIYARATGGKADRLEVMQLPNVVDEAWAGRAVPSAPGRVSLLAFIPEESPALATENNLRGLLLDDWVEGIPSLDQETALAFHYDHPNAEAPQAVLVAVPARATWSLDDLLGAVTETFDLTDVRSIDPESLSVAPILPAPCLTFGPNLNPVSTDLSESKQSDRAYHHF